MSPASAHPRRRIKWSPSWPMWFSRRDDHDFNTLTSAERVNPGSRARTATPGENARVGSPYPSEIGRLLRLAVVCIVAGCSEAVGPSAGPVVPTETPHVLFVQIEPTVTKPGEPFRLSLRISGTEATRVHAHPLETLRLRLDGVVQDSLILYDDGTHGDLDPTDGWYTADGLVLPLNADGMGAVTLSGFSALHAPGAAHGEAVQGIRASFRSGDPAVVGSPPVVELAQGVRATTRVAAITDAAARDLGESAVEHAVRRFYEVFPDDRDFLVVEIPPTAGADWSARAYQIRNDAGGIGLDIARWRDYGSPDQLSLAVHTRMAVYSSHEGERGSFCLLTHELTHRWAAYVGAPLADAGGHWRTNVLDRPTSALGDPVGCIFNDLELYLAGFLSADSIASPLSKDGYTIAQLVSEHGLRTPVVPEAPSAFTIGFIVVAEAPLSDFELAWFDHMAGEYTAPSSALGPNWSEATGGRSSLDLDLTLPGLPRYR